jgi:YD repeat-containing protein
MKVLFSIFFLFCFLPSIGQRVPISVYTYDSCTIIDNYFGEKDSLLQLYNITTVIVYSIDSSEVLYRIENYRDGKKIMVQEFDSKSGKPDRTIQYTYGDNVLDAEIVHYPSANNFNIFPSQRHRYLTRMVNSNEERSLYKRDDTITYLVRMHIRHTFRDDGSILFESFNKDGELIETHVMKPVVSWTEYQQRKRKQFPATIVHTPEESRYDEKGRLVSYKNTDMNRERIYTYDTRGLLSKMDLFEKGKKVWSTIYQYQ